MDHRSLTGDIDGNSEQTIGLAREIVRYLSRKIVQPSLMLDWFRINYDCGSTCHSLSPAAVGKITLEK